MISSIDQIDPALDLTRELLSRMACESIVALPLLVRDRLVGVLTFALKVPHEFTPEERATLDNCADIFSPGIANAIAYEAGTPASSALRGGWERDCRHRQRVRAVARVAEHRRRGKAGRRRGVRGAGDRRR